jgi:hypothetical protein
MTLKLSNAKSWVIWKIFITKTNHQLIHHDQVDTMYLWSRKNIDELPLSLLFSRLDIFLRIFQIFTIACNITCNQEFFLSFETDKPVISKILDSLSKQKFFWKNTYHISDTKYKVYAET